MHGLHVGKTFKRTKMEVDYDSMIFILSHENRTEVSLHYLLRGKDKRIHGEYTQKELS
jgi:hypothetical protein